jgi:hypothetical protein
MPAFGLGFRNRWEPTELQGALPSVEELEAELAKLDQGNLEELCYGG